MAICLSRSRLHPSSPCPVPWNPDLHEQPWQAPLPSGFWWGQAMRRTGRHFVGGRRTSLGYLFPWLPAYRVRLGWMPPSTLGHSFSHMAVSMQLPSLGFGNHSPPMRLQNSGWPPLPSAVSSGGLYYLLLVPSPAHSLVKSLELLPSDYSGWVYPLFLADILPDMHRFIDLCTVLPHRFL